MEKSIKISAVVPVYNEEPAIGESLNNLINCLFRLKADKKIADYEIIVVNDASTDKTAEIIKNINGIKVITHSYNKGNGGAIKTGARAAQYDYLLFYDSDGQHNPEYIEEMIKHIPENEMVVGSRTGYKGPAIRQPGKKILTWVANYLVDQKIPDINSGFRLIKKELFLKNIHILPNSFSAYTTITLALFKEGANIKYIPVIVNKRLGTSTVQPKHAAITMLLILRVIMLFNPLKVFMPLSLMLFIISFFLIVFDVALQHRISISTAVIFLTTILTFILGLLADQISAIRREIKK
jgi:glycosyltransferase involved in cell wall biosynthesis